MHRKEKDKQKWAIEKPKLDNGKRLRGIHFIDPDGEEFKRKMESSKFRCQQQCLVNFNVVRTGRFVAQLENTTHNMLVLLNPTNL